jgi:hypothetical protein
MSHRRALRPNVFSRLWSKAFASGRRKAVSSHRPRVRPQLESLEDRLVPAVIDVTTLAATGAGSLSAAFQTANTNGQTSNTIDITVAGTYNIGQVGALQIFANATNGQSGLSLTVQNTSGGTVAISGDNMTRVFDINPNDINGGATPNGTVLGTVTITGLTIENGLASSAGTPDGPAATGGGIRDQGPVPLTLNNDLITNNSATADGGGVSMENLASTKWVLTLNNTTVTNNHAGDAGGGVEEDGTGLVSINNSTIADNTTLNQGGGIWLDAINNGTATLNVTNSIVSGNTAGMLGGGIGNAGTSTVTITNSTIADNFTTGDGGGFANQAALGTPIAGTLNVVNSLFLDNSASVNGGGIEEGNVLTITNSEIKGNAAGINGAMPIGSSGGKPNTVMGSGGGLFVDGGSLTLTASTIADNTATINGGGIELDTTAASTITNSTIVGNTALNNAGGVTVVNGGGGIDDGATGTVALTNDTITNNFAVDGGGIFFAGTTGLTLENTILAQNIVTGDGPDFDFTNAVTGIDLGGNLIGVGDTTIFTATTTQQGTATDPLNPMVSGLTNNGGPLAGASGDQMTVETEALLPGSSAIGKGMVLTTVTQDERGAPRVNTNDIGAFQFEDATLKLTIGTQSTLGLGASETVTVTVTNTSGNPLPADNSTLTVTATSGLNIGGTQTFTLGALAAGQSQSFSFNATGTAAGTQALTATVTSVDTNPATVTTSVPVTVSQTTTPPVTPPTGALTLFAFGFGPTGLDLFEINGAGDVFAVPFMGGGAPILINTALHLPVAALENGQLLALLTSSSGQNFVIDLVNPFAVLPEVLAALHL